MPKDNSGSALDPALIARALEVLANPTPSSPELDELIYAFMTAESLGLSGIETSVEEILALTRAHDASERSSETVPERAPDLSDREHESS